MREFALNSQHDYKSVGEAQMQNNKCYCSLHEHSKWQLECSLNKYTLEWYTTASLFLKYISWQFTAQEIDQVVLLEEVGRVQTSISYC